MDNTEIAAKLLPAFSILHYYIRHHKAEEPLMATEESKSAKIKKGQKVSLQVRDFTLLWLIDLISRTDEECFSKTVESITVWRRSQTEPEKTTKNRFQDRGVNRLVAVGLVRSEENKSDRRYNKLSLTEDGKNYLKGLEKGRIKILSEILDFVGREINDIEHFIEVFEQISKQAWLSIQEQAKI